MARIFSDASSIQARMFRTVVDTGSSVLMFVVGLAILLVLDWRIAAAAALVMVPYFSVIRRVRIRLSAVNTELWHTNSCLWGLAAQKLDSVKAIFAYGRERHESLNFHRLTACFTRDALAQQRLSAGLSRSTQIITGLTTAAIFVFCAQQVLGAEMTLGEMMYVYGAAANLFTPVLGLSDISLVLMDLLVVLRRMTEVLDEQREIREAPGAVDFPLRLNSGIELRHLNFAYGEDPDDLVLRNINLTVPAGKWVCIMGPSGSGKTTLINLIARLYDPVEGEILADGIPLSKIKFVSLRTRMALVPQEPQILSGTIRDNITYGFSDAEPGTILAAARAAECHDFIMDLDVKYETMVGERGITLSGGQRQRLSIARALITNPDVLLLDDCTSALDAETEQRIQETLSRLMAGKTALVVSQRVSMAMRCHEICVLEDGAITERGTHAELVARGGFYARLYAQQTQGAEPAKPQ
jgi:ABC-type multidrug transport system fused ATPase/permease subunit